MEQYLAVNSYIENKYSVVTCPHCQAFELVEIPTGFSQHLYRCPSCLVILKPKSGDCCIFCSFGSHDCASSEKNMAA